MKILLDGYFDHNLGDDLMLTLAAEGLKEHDLYVPSDQIKIDNVQYTTAKTGFDAYLKVIGSGFQIYNTLGIAYRLRDMYRENRYAPIKAVISCNISEPLNLHGGEVIKKHLSQFDYITMRDKFSYGYIRKNLPRLNTEIFPDIVFSLPDSMIPDTPCESLLGIAVHNSADCEKLALLADSYIKETGRGVLLLCFDTGAENDILAAEKIKASAKYKDKMEIIPYKNIPDMLTQIKRCSCILGIRMHSIILAARMGISFVPMLYSMKTLHMLSSVDYKRTMYMADNFEVDAVLKRVLTEAPFELGSGIIKSAQNHIEKFKDYIEKRQG